MTASTAVIEPDGLLIRRTWLHVISNLSFASAGLLETE